jgi:amino acid transporter
LKCTGAPSKSLEVIRGWCILDAILESKPSVSAALRRELGLRDVTLFAIACIIGTRWISPAAHAGPGSVLLWILAAVFFTAPLAVAVAALTVKYPGAGGLYLWTRGDFGPWHGFLSFWIYWMSIAFWFPSAALAYMSMAVYTLGPAYTHLGDNRFYLVLSSLAAIWIALGTNLIGMRIGKWTENLGGASAWVLGAVLAVVAALSFVKRGSATPLDIMPRWSWETVSFWSTIAYAMSGLELAGLMGGEIRDPARTLPRAGWIASAFAVAFYAAATVALLILLPPAQISELNGLAQGGKAAAGWLRAAWLAPLIALLVLAGAIGQFGGLGTAVSRLPFAAGVDHLLPPAFARIHPRWATPHVSILTFGVVASFLLVAIQLGDTLRAAYQELVSLMVIAGFLPYLYIFASAWRAGKRLSAVSGLAVTVLAILCAVIPTAAIANVALFEAKLAGGTLAVIVSAWLLYRRAASRS